MPLSRLVALCSAVLLGSAVYAQIPDISAKNAPPIPGVGHDYYGVVTNLATETVVPSTGALALSISLPTPPSRGAQLPVSLTYNSAGILQRNSFTGQGEATSTNALPGTGPGWNFTLPFITFMGVEAQINGIYDSSVSCHYSTNFTFHDGGSIAHDISVLKFVDDTYTCNNYAGSFDQLTSGDGYVSASLSSTYDQRGAYWANPVTVEDQNGTRFYFSNFLSTTLSGVPAWYAYPSKITDRNGNYWTVTQGNDGSFNVTTSIGLSALNASSRSSVQTLSSSSWSSPATLTWTTNTVTTPGLHSDNFDSNSGAYVASNQTTGVVHGPVLSLQSMTMPDGSVYSFEYDSSWGYLNKINYPNGGYVSYTWGIFPREDFVSYTTQCGSGCGFSTIMHRDAPAIVKREVSYDGSTIAQTQTFSYSKTWPTNPNGTPPPSTKQTVITTIDNVRDSTTLPNVSTPTTSTTTINYTELGLYTLGQGTDVEISTTVSSGGVVLSSKKQSWLDQYRIGCVALSQDSQSSGVTVYSYQGMFPSDVAQFDYGQASSATCPDSGTGTANVTGLPAAARETSIDYTAFSDSAIVGKPSRIRLFQSGGQNPIRETDYAYDEFKTFGVSNPVNWDASIGNIANLTTVTMVCSGACANDVAKYKYDSTGQMTESYDAADNKTTYSYADAFDTGAVPNGQQANAFVTSITRPTTTAGAASTQHTSSFAYDYSSGRLTRSKDENSVSTSYSYNDPLGRITNMAPTGGSSIAISYNDSGSSPNVAATKQIDAAKSVTTTSYSDGLGHVVRQDTTDPSSTNSFLVSIYTAYDGFGRVMQKSNPVWGEATSSDKTNYGYDGIGRQVVVSHQDETTISRNYLGPQTTVTDERGMATIRRMNAFGDLVFVQEPSLSNQSVGTKTAYAYDAMGNLTSVSQDAASASPKSRTYLYDALGRLSSSTNPESGFTNYKYVNAAGTVCSGVASLVCQRTTGNGVVTFTYDALNRITSKQVGGSDTSKFYGANSCYLYDAYGGSNPTNAVGRMTAEWTQRAFCPTGATTVPAGVFSRKIIDGYDSMGRLTSQRTCALTSCTLEHPQTSSFDLAGDLTGFTDGRSSGRTFSLSYDGAGRFNLLQTPVTGSSSALSLYDVKEFQPFGPSRAVVGGVITWKNSYDVRGRITSGTAIQGLQ